MRRGSMLVVIEGVGSCFLLLCWLAWLVRSFGVWLCFSFLLSPLFFLLPSFSISLLLSFGFHHLQSMRMRIERYLMEGGLPARLVSPASHRPSPLPPPRMTAARRCRGVVSSSLPGQNRLLPRG